MLAIPRAPVAIANAPWTPSDFIERKTLTTIRFSGIPNIFMMTDRWLSGIYFERRVLIDGKYVPTHISKIKKAVTRATRLFPPMKVATAIAAVAMTSITEVDISTRFPLD